MEAIDTLIQDRHLEMIKAAIPYLDNSRQRNMAMLVIIHGTAADHGIVPNPWERFENVLRGGAGRPSADAYRHTGILHGQRKRNDRQHDQLRPDVFYLWGLI